MSDAYALSTKDNPYNPFDNFDSWYMFDLDKGYDSCGYLARVARTSEQLSDEENAKQIENAIDDIVSSDFTNMFIKIKK